MRMLRPAAVVLALVLLPAAAWAVTLDEIVYLSKAGVSESVILALIDRDKTVFTISPDQLLSLKHDGVSDAVVLAMLKSGRSEGEGKNITRLTRKKTTMTYNDFRLRTCAKCGKYTDGSGPLCRSCQRDHEQQAQRAAKKVRRWWRRR